MNWPNRLSLIRIALVPFVVLMMYVNLPFSYLIALLLFVIASFTDFLDGQIARRQNLVTNFGKFIDPVADKLLVLSTMMLPAQILMIPQFMWYRHLNWVGTYYPMILPYFFAIQGFFVYLIMNFIGGIPKSLDEAAKIDGCSYYGIFFHVILPLIVPALVTSAIFSFIWRWDDYLSALLYVNRADMRPVSLALQLFNDPSSGSDIGSTLAMTTLSIVPATIIFLIFQKSLVEGIASTGIKG